MTTRAQRRAIHPPAGDFRTDPPTRHVRDSRDPVRRTTTTPKWRADQVPPDHLEWAKTRHTFGYVPCMSVRQLYQFVAPERLIIPNGYMVGGL